MEYIEEDKVLLDEELCAKSVDGEDEITKATIRFRENIRLANHIAYKMSSPRDAAIDKDDILQSAYEGLWIACLKFDESLGYQFSTYAVPTIKGMIWKMLRDNEAISTPRYFKDIRYALYSHGFTLPLTDEEVEVLVSEGKFSKAQILSYSEPNIISLDSYVNDDEDSSTYAEIIRDPDSVDMTNLSEDAIEAIIDKILIYIKPLHRDLVEEWIYATLAGQHIGQQTLARKYKISQAQASRVIRHAISLVKMHGDDIRDLLGV